MDSLRGETDDCYTGWPEADIPRLGPPSPSRQNLLRSRLLDALAERWELPVVVIVAGAGFGKTTLLGQMMRQRLGAPSGLDRWLGCRVGDATFSGLASGLEAALDIPPLPVDNPARQQELLAAAFAHHSPTQVCLILDDVHLIPPGSPGSALLRCLVEVLPSNGHLVLAGRREPSVPLARLQVQGRILRLDEDELALSEPEIGAFAELRGRAAAELAGSSGWPALAELAAAAGPHDAQVTQFLWEEVLGELPAPTLRTLAVLTELGAIDAGLLCAATVGLDDAETLAVDHLTGLPLVGHDGGHWYRHDLWVGHLDGVLTTEETRLVRRQAAAHLAGTGDIDAAFRLYLAAGDEDSATETLRRACDATHPPVPLDVLEEWIRLIPPGQRDTPAALLVQGVAAKASEPGPERAKALLDQAADGFAARDDADGELAALVHLAHLGLWTGDTASQFEVVGRVLGLEGRGHSLAGCLASVARANFALVTGQREMAMAAIEQIPRHVLNQTWSDLVEVLRATVHLDDGRPGEALAILERAGAATSSEFGGLVGLVRFRARWALGDIRAALADGPRMLACAEQEGRLETRQHTRAGLTLASAYAGRREDALQLLSDLEIPDTAYSRLAGTIALARACCLVLDGDEAEAATILAADRKEYPLHELSNWYARADGVALHYLLIPESRAEWETLPLPVPAAQARDTAALLVAVRAGNTRMASRHDLLPWDQGDLVISRIPFPWAVELAVAATVDTRDAAARRWLTDHANPGREVLERLAASYPGPVAVSKQAARLLRQLPGEPAAPVRIEVLGEMRVLVDGVLTSAPAWRRGLVRKLLLYLTLHGPTTRDAVIDALWPDQTPAAGLNNLRVTLHHLNRVLEPARGSGVAPTVVRHDSGRIGLSASLQVQVDLAEFDRAIESAAAADREGRLAVARDQYLAAAALYRGDVAVGVDAVWVDLARSAAKARFVTGALRAGGLLLAEGQIPPAIDLAGRVLATDQWSEPAFRLLAAAHLAGGDRQQARVALDRGRKALAELGLEPQPETRYLDQLIDRPSHYPGNESGSESVAGGGN